MSSDTYYISVQSIKDATVTLLCHTSTAGGVNDYAATRSFALMAIEDGMPYAGSGGGTPLQRALREISGGATPPVWEKSFHQEHVGKFIESTKLLERRGIIRDEGRWYKGRNADGISDEEAKRDYPLHSFVLEVKVTDTRWLEGLSLGGRHGTTAFDAWWDDPTRQSLREFAAIERKASRWKPPAKKAPAKRVPVAEKVAVKKTAAKKTAVKASATKKTAVKASAAKKTAVKATATKKTAAKKTASKKTAARKTTAPEAS